MKNSALGAYTPAHAMMLGLLGLAGFVWWQRKQAEQAAAPAALPS